MTERRNIRLCLEYDGSGFSGWQVQTNAVTVQGELEKALALITRQPARVTGASRTDAGVHARGQVCNFYTTSKLPVEKFPAALNSNLPPGISVVSADKVADDFHSRFSAVGKRYTYLVSNRPVRPALQRNFCYHVPQRLDLAKMQEAASYLAGKHDFASFQAAGSSVKDTVRHLWSLDISAPELGHLVFEVRGNGFLYNMVRIIVGTLLWVGTSRMQPCQIPIILDKRDRKLAGPTVPPQGLCLQEIYYDGASSTP